MEDQSKEITYQELREAADKMFAELDKYEEKVRRVIGEMQDVRDKAIEDAQDTDNQIMKK